MQLLQLGPAQGELQTQFPDASHDPCPLHVVFAEQSNKINE